MSSDINLLNSRYNIWDSHSLDHTDLKTNITFFVPTNFQYREEDDSKIEDLLDQEIAEQVNVVPDGMEWVQQALFDMNKNMMNNMQTQINAFGASLMQRLPDMISK